MGILVNDPTTGIVSCEELFAGRRATPFDYDGERNYTRRFRVIVRRNDITEEKVVKAVGIPKQFSFYATDTGAVDLLAVCTRLTAEQEHQDDWQSWIVTADYSTRMPNRGPADYRYADDEGGAQNNPELEPAEIEWSGETVHKAIQNDLDGKPFWNTAGQPFTPAPTFEYAYATVTITKNQLIFDRETAVSYAYAVNSDTFMGATAGTAQMLPIQARSVFRGVLNYYRVTYKIRFIDFPFPDGQDDWQPRILNAGLSRLDDDLSSSTYGQPIPITRLGGVPISQPVPLDEDGQPLKPISGVWPGGKRKKIFQPVYLKFRVYKSKSFTDLIKNL